jgi:hypothetical protein
VAAETGAGKTQQAERKNARDVFASPLVIVIRAAPELFIVRGESRFLLHAGDGVNNFRCIRALLREATNRVHSYGQIAACC